MIKAIFFDFWGTLIEDGLHPSVIQQTRDIMGLQDVRFSEYVITLENVLMTKKFEDKHKAFEELCNAFGVPPTDEIIEKLIGLWNTNILTAKPYEDTMEVLEQLKKDYKIILISNMPSFSEQALDKFDFKNKFDMLIISCDVGLLKTNPRMFRLGLDKFGLTPDEAVMVGDSIPTDIIGARKAGIKAVLMDRNDRREYSPKITNLQDLYQFLE